MAVAPWSMPSLAQLPAESDEGPIIIGQQKEIEKLHFEPFTAGLDLINVYERDRVKTADANNTSSELFLQQSLDLGTRGYVLHPNFLNLSLNGSFGVSEAFFDSNGNSDESYGTVYTWDARGTFLGGGDAPLTLYSRRDQQWLFRQFGPALQATTTETGASLDLRSSALPTQLQYSHLESTQTAGATGQQDFSYTRDAFNWTSTARPAPNQRLTWNYTFASVSQTGGFNSYDTHDAVLSHELVFGNVRQNTLTSTLAYSQQTGDVDFRHFRWDERLELKHSDSLRTRWGYNFDSYAVAGTDRTQNRATAGFTQRLYNSLVTNGNFIFQTTDTSAGADSTEYYADLNLDYTKRVPWGTLFLNTGGSFSRQESGQVTRATQVLDQPATFTDPLPIVLSGRNIRPGSLVLTDPSGILVYSPGVDYTVNNFPDRVEIDRVVGGRITSGQGVLLDYILEPSPANNTNTTAYFFGGRYSIQEDLFKGLDFYARYTRTDQDIESTSASFFVPNSATDILYGVTYRIEDISLGSFEVGDITLNYERQHHDSVVSPFDATRYSAALVHRFGVDALGTLGAAYNTVNFPEDNNHLTLWTTSATLQYRFSQYLDGVATVLYRDENSTLLGSTRGLEAQLELNWQYRQTKVYARLRQAMLDTESEKSDFQFFQVGLRREF